TVEHARGEFRSCEVPEVGRAFVISDGTNHILRPEDIERGFGVEDNEDGIGWSIYWERPKWDWKNLLKVAWTMTKEGMAALGLLEILRSFFFRRLKSS
ncbi:hypothetical protein LCGC14_3003370, partial [marine sediment metagenome]